MKDLKDLDDRMVDTKNDILTGATVEDMTAPGPGRHHHEEGLEDAVVGGGAEDIIDAERKWKYWIIILPNIMKNNKSCIHNKQLGIPILILKRTNIVALC